MDFDLTDEQQLIRDTAREFTDNEVVERSRENARNHHFDIELVAKMAAQGYLGAIVPQEYGGAGLDYVSYGLIVEEIGRGDSALRTVISVQTSLVCSASSSGAPRSRSTSTCPSSAPASGSAASASPSRTAAPTRPACARARRAPTTAGCSTARRCGSRWATTPSSRSSSPRPTPSRSTAGWPASSSRPTSPASSRRTSSTRWVCTPPTRHRSRSTTCTVGEDDMLGEIGDGFKVAMSSLDSGRYSVAAGCVGICQGCVDESVSYAQERVQFGRPIASFQLIQAMIADMVLKADASRLLVLARRRPQGQGTAEHHRDVDRQAARHRVSSRVRERRHPGPRRRRLRRRPPGRALLPRCARHDPLRGHVADPEAHHRPREHRHQRVRPGMTDAASTVGVLGAGTMGAGIAQLACQAGAQTLLHDPIPEALERGARSVRGGLRAEARRRDKLDAAEAQSALERLHVIDDLGELKRRRARDRGRARAHGAQARPLRLARRDRLRGVRAGHATPLRCP